MKKTIRSSVSDPDSIGSADSDLDWESGSRKAKLAPQNGKNLEISTFEESALKRFKATYMTVYQKIVHLNFFRNFVIINHGLGPDPD
jgi:hypothetical protein